MCLSFQRRARAAVRAAVLSANHGASEREKWRGGRAEMLCAASDYNANSLIHYLYGTQDAVNVSN